MSAGRVLPLNRRAEDALIDFELEHREAMRDGKIDEREATALVARMLPIVAALRLMIGTWCCVKACLDSARGIYSPKVQRGIRETVARYPDNVIQFPRMDDGDEAA